MNQFVRYAYLLTLFLVAALWSDTVLAQVDDIICGTTTALEQPGSLPAVMVGTVARGGREITNQGVLRVLVVFVRFADDVQNTAGWPDYAVLPAWAQHIVDTSVPAPGGRYTPKNLSDFFDRASGGDGNGNLGLLRVIGDVYYVTTDLAESSYGDDGAVYRHIWSKLDDPNGAYRVNFALYDNWRFIKNGEFYNHENVSDGIVDYIFMNWRVQSIQGGTNYVGYSTLYTSYTTNDGVTIQSTSGSSQYRYTEMGAFDALDTWKARSVYVPAHEFSHYLFGGSHLDHDPNVGNVEFFALMTKNPLGNMCAYERYRAGWLNPDVIVQNESNRILQDTYVKNKAVMLPIRTDANNNTVEYFLIENYHSQNDYAGASPFLRRQIFDNYLQKGLLVYHVENEDLVSPPSSNLDIDCADGLWQWAVVQGASTPSDRTDDLIGHAAPTYNSGFDERDKIAITVGTEHWTDYMALRTSDNGCGTGAPCNPPCNAVSCNHGWRYTMSAYLGDNRDFFREGENDVFSRYSNPNTDLSAGGVTNKAFEIASYSASTKEYVLKIGVNYNGTIDLKPSKPQNLQVSKNAELAGSLSWNPNSEADVVTGGGYNIYRAYYYTGGPSPVYVKINGSLVTSSSYVDNDFSGVSVPSGTSLSLRYRITAVDNTAKESVRSDSSQISYSSSEFGRALGYQGRSDSPAATASNSQRKLYLDSDGNLHVVFQSGGEVFYRKSTDNGATWQITNQISDGSGTNSSPSITGRYDDPKDCQRFYCVWQKGASSNYSVVYNYYSTGGGGWLASPVTLASSINCSGPAPVIQASGPDVSPELMIAWKDASQLKAAYATSKTPGSGSWTIYNVANTNSSSQNPTLLWQPTVYPYWHLAWDASGTIYSECYSSGSWFSLVSFCPPYGGHTLPSIAVNVNHDIHLFWHGEGTYYHPSIIGNKNLNPSVFTAFQDYSLSYYGASVTGHSGGRASLLWYDSQNNIKKAVYDGTNWSGISSIASSGKYVTTSITNNPGGSAWAMWTSTSGPPYALLKGPANPLSKTPAENGPNMIAGLKYSRELAIRDTSTGATLVLEVDEPQILNADGSVSRIPFATVDDTVHYATPDLVKLLQTQAVVLPSSQSTIRLKRSLCVNLAGQNLPASLNTTVAFEVVSSTTGSVLSSQTVPVPESEAQNIVDSLMQFIVSGPQAGVKFRVHLTGTLSNQARAYLLHVYSPDTSNGSLQREGLAQLATGVPSETRLLQNYPNPFNPTTRIQYQLAEDSHVALRLYDILGREVRSLMEGEQQAGYYEVTLDGTQLASGIYLARMVVTDQLGKTKFTGVTKLILMK